MGRGDFWINMDELHVLSITYILILSFLQEAQENRPMVI